MKINLTQLNRTQSLTTASHANKKPTSNSNSQSAKRSTEAGSISAILREAHTELNKMPDIDMEKVMSLRAAIGEGKIQINTDKLVEAMLKYHRG